MFHDVTLPDLLPWERSAIYQSMLDTLVHLHSIPLQSLGLAGFSTSDYCQRQVSSYSTFVIYILDIVKFLGHLMNRTTVVFTKAVGLKVMK